MERKVLKEFRESQMISKTELARETKLSLNTINRVEKGYPCRIGTKRKIALALGIKFADYEKVFPGS